MGRAAEGLAFDSALYLGFRHPHGELEPWDGLTEGAPDALRPSRGLEPARELARLQGCEDALWSPSSFHAFWDAFGILPRSLGPGATVVLDRGAYPIASWGAVRARAAGHPVLTSPHFDPSALEALLDGLPPGARPILCCDGYCPGCGRLAPLREYRDAVAARGGILLLDDTQSLGLLGDPVPGNPYGTGGRGSPARCGIDTRGLIIISSLAKAFGAPLAGVSGDGGWIRRLRDSGTRAHCSPPSNAHLAAAARALDRNRRQGEALRASLLALVRRFREGCRSLARLGLGLRPGAFPIQVLAAGQGADPESLHLLLKSRGIATVLNDASTRLPEGHGPGGKSLSILFTARHPPSAVDRLLEELDWAASRALPRPRNRQATLAPSGA